MNQNLTPEQEQDVRERVEAFKAEYLELVSRYQVDFSSYPQYVQNEKGSFDTFAAMAISDKKYVPIASNFDEPHQ